MTIVQRFVQQGPVRPRTASLAAVLLVGAIGLAGCGNEGDESATDPSSSPSSSETSTSEPTESSPTESSTGSPTETESAEPTEPACADVWVAGQVLEKKYQGCYDADQGKWVQAMVYPCSSGQKVVTFRRNFYAPKGGPIVETTVPLAKDKTFQTMMATCTS